MKSNWANELAAGTQPTALNREKKWALWSRTVDYDTRHQPTNCFLEIPHF